MIDKKSRLTDSDLGFLDGQTRFQSMGGEIMRTSALILIVVVLHCAIIGALFFVQGCGTTKTTGAPPPTPVMPPQQPAVETPEKPLLPEPAAKPAELKKPEAAGTTEYIVKAGDSVAAIAKRYHVSKAAIIDLNKLADANKLRVGQKLILPPAGAAAPAAAKPHHEAAAKPASKTAAPEPAALAGNEYVVQPGDSLSKIASRSGVKVSALREANKLPNDKLKVGQKLVIPAKDAAKETAVGAKPAEAKAPEAKPTDAPVTVPPAGQKAPAEATPAPAPAVTPPPSAAPAPAAAGSGITHIVQPNEDLNSIAKLYAVTVAEIAELNRLTTNQTVQVGQRLKIP